jgi:hypothetical protein
MARSVIRRYEMPTSDKRSLALPSQLSITIEPTDAHSTVAGAIAGISCFARTKNDCCLSPLFADSSGVVTASAESLEILACARYESDLMGSAPIESFFSFVEIRLWRRSDVERAIAGRRQWGLLGREAELFESLETLVERYEASPSLELAESSFPPRVRDEWLRSEPKNYSIPMG